MSVITYGFPLVSGSLAWVISVSSTGGFFVSLVSIILHNQYRAMAVLGFQGAIMRLL